MKGGGQGLHLTILHCRYHNDRHHRQQHSSQSGADVEHEANGQDHLQRVASQHTDIGGDSILYHLCVRGKSVSQLSRPARPRGWVEGGR